MKTIKNRPLIKAESNPLGRLAPAKPATPAPGRSAPAPAAAPISPQRKLRRLLLREALECSVSDRKAAQWKTK